jgi:YD repeat-containing protein
MDLSYTYDANGNVLTRSDSTMGRSEGFSYDGLSRLRSRTLSTLVSPGPPGPGTPVVSGPPQPSRARYQTTTERYDYDDLGNLTT